MIKKGVSVKKLLELGFRIFIFITEVNDYIQYIYYIGIFNNQDKYQRHKQWNLNFYFIECLCWLLHYLSELK
jgi:hypothetical protein